MAPKKLKSLPRCTHKLVGELRDLVILFVASFWSSPKGVGVFSSLCVCEFPMPWVGWLTIFPPLILYLCLS